MKFKGTWVLIIVAIALGLYVYFIEIKKAEKDEEKKSASEKVINFDAEKVQKISLKNSLGDFEIEKKDGHWNLTRPVTDIADESTVTSLLSSLSGEKFDEIIDSNDVKTFGLDDPKMAITLVMKDNSQKQISVGMDAPLPGKIYLQRGDDKKVLFANASIKSDLEKGIKDLRDKRIFRGNKDEISLITASYNTKDFKGKIGLSKNDGQWILDGLKEKADNEIMTAFMNAIDGLRATDFPSENAGSDDKKYSLDKPAVILKLGAKEKSLGEILISPKKDNNTAFIKVSDRPTIYKVFSTALDNILHKPSDFRDKKGPFEFNKDNASEILIKNPLAEVHLNKKGASWELGVPDPQKQVSQIQVSNFLDKVSSLKVADYLESESPKGLNPPNGKITIKDANGEILLEFEWGERTKVQRNYFAKTNKYKELISVEGSSVDSIPVQTLVETKALPTPSPTGTKGQTTAPSSKKDSQGKPTEVPESILPHPQGPTAVPPVPEGHR